MSFTSKKFDYEKKRWGITPIKNFYKDFQGQEVSDFIGHVVPLVKKDEVNLLDLGCGGGNIAGFLIEKFPRWKITGIDISKESISIARKIFSKVSFLNSGASRIDKKDKSFDIITCFDSLEHFEEIDKVLKEAQRLLKDYGVLYVSVPLEKQFPSFYWVLYKFGWRGKMKFAGHVNFFDSRELETLLYKYNFKLLEKRYSYHLFFSILDISYYFFQSLLGNRADSFETSIFQTKPGIKKTLLTFFKETISTISYIESRVFSFFPGGKGHFVFIKERKNDFFSLNPPITVLEEDQVKVGLSRGIRPKDIQIKNYFSKLKFDKSGNVLDFGCGNGIWLERVLGNNMNGLGVDVSDKLIEFANSRFPKKGKYVCNMDKNNIGENEFDFCFSFDVFEHIESKEKELKKIHKAMKKGGKFLFYTLNPDNKYTFDWIFEKFGSNFLYKRANHDKKIFIGPENFLHLLKKEGFNKIGYELYDGPVNLFWDVSAYIYMPVIEKILKAVRIQVLMIVVIYLNDLFFRLIMPFNSLLDKFFFIRGHSNGYFIWGEK